MPLDEKQHAGEYAALRETFFKFVESTFIREDYNSSLETLSDDVIASGIDGRGYYVGKDGVGNALKSIHSNTKWSVQYGKIIIQISSSNCASVAGEVFLSAESGGRKVKSGIVQMAGARKENGAWLFFMLSSSPIDIKEGGIKAHPSLFSDENELATLRLKTEEQSHAISECIKYSSKIQKNLLPSDDVLKHSVSDYSVIWKPRDTVGGDIYWVRDFDEGAVLCVCDCTGHGVPGALLTMFVVSAFEAAVNESNYKDTAGIVWMLERKLVSVFNKDTGAGMRRSISSISGGCDLAVLYIDKEGSVDISAGHTHVFVCNGTDVRQIKGQNINIGEGRLKNKEDIKVVHVPSEPGNKFYVASDGLFNQIGGDYGLPFGYAVFKQIILGNHNEKQAVISDKIWEAFEFHRGVEPIRDDLELITFKP